ncbi:MAG: glycosyltransferase family 4 protein [Nitrospinae bacterium]|nr:glycosyltransferase family 4 protein [Nitrospinota bacterium]
MDQSQTDGMQAVNVLFDLRPLQGGFKAHKKRGIGVYARSLAARRLLAPGNLSISGFHDPCFESAEAEAAGSGALAIGPLTTFARVNFKEFFTQHLFMRKVIEKHARAAKADILFFPTHLDVPMGLGAPYVVTAHDMIQSALKERFYTSLKHRLHTAAQAAVLRGARLVIAVSEHTKWDVVKYAGVDPARIAVVHNGVDPVFRPGVMADLSRFKLPDRFILNVGGIDWRKNVDLLLHAFGRLREKEPDVYLLMAGDIKGDPQYAKFTARLESEKLDRAVIELGYVAAEELAALYGKAAAFFYPSVYEGFGLPVLEAMACGTPVVSTNLTSIPEVAGSAAILLDPSAKEDFAEALIRLVRSQDERGRLSQAGLSRAQQFGWDKCATETFNLISRVV